MILACMLIHVTVWSFYVELEYEQKQPEKHQESTQLWGRGTCSVRGHHAQGPRCPELPRNHPSLEPRSLRVCMGASASRHSPRVAPGWGKEARPGEVLTPKLLASSGRAQDTVEAAMGTMATRWNCTDARILKVGYSTENNTMTARTS